MSHEDDYGIPPYRPERDTELEVEATVVDTDEQAQRAEEPILPAEEDEDEQTDIEAWGDATSNLY